MSRYLNTTHLRQVIADGHTLDQRTILDLLSRVERQQDAEHKHLANTRITPELINAIAQAPYQGQGAPCPWDAVDPLTRHALRTSAKAFLTNAIPPLIHAGWTPPPTPPPHPDTCSCTFTNIHDGTGELHRVDQVVDPACTVHPYCYRCDFGKHTCPGCGTTIPHGTTACSTCINSDDTTWTRAALAPCTCTAEVTYQEFIGGAAGADRTPPGPHCLRHRRSPSEPPGKPEQGPNATPKIPAHMNTTNTPPR